MDLVRGSMVLCVVACAPGMDEQGGSVESSDVSALERACAPQAWPIDEEGHQLERVTVDDGPGLTTWWVPEDPRGLVVMLHANKKDSSHMFTIEHEEMYNEFAMRDLAYVVVSNTGGDWNLQVRPDNQDYARILEVRDRLIDETPIRNSTPMFAMGFSGGSMFASVFAQLATDDGYDVRGFSSHNTGPRSTAPVPAIFVSHANDNPRGLENAYDDQSELGLPTVLFALEEGLVQPMRFTKEPRIDQLDSEAFFHELMSFDMIDKQGHRLVPDNEIGISLDAFNRNSAYDDSSKARHQLNVLWRKHVFSADRACFEAEFFADQL